MYTLYCYIKVTELYIYRVVEAAGCKAGWLGVEIHGLMVPTYLFRCVHIPEDFTQ